MSVVDWDYLKSTFSIEVIRKIISAYQKETGEKLAELETLIKLESGADAKKIAHQLKGASANIGADSLREDFQSLEQYLVEKKFSESTELFNLIKEKVSIIENELEDRLEN